LFYFQAPAPKSHNPRHASIFRQQAIFEDFSRISPQKADPRRIQSFRDFPAGRKLGEAGRKDEKAGGVAQMFQKHGFCRFLTGRWRCTARNSRAWYRWCRV
jgi:hypothetical protein